MPDVIRDPRPNNVNSAQKKYGVAYWEKEKTYVYYDKEPEENKLLRFLPAGVVIKLIDPQPLENPVPFDNGEITHFTNKVEINHGNLNSQKVLKHIYDNLQWENLNGKDLKGHFDKF